MLAIYRNRASIEEPSRLRAHPTAKRLTLLAVLCFMRAQEITDGLVDLLIQIVHKIDVRAEKRVEQEYVNEFKRVANKEGILYRIAEATIAHPNEPVNKVVFPVASEKLLQDVIKEYKAKSPAFRQQVHTIMRASYKGVLVGLLCRANWKRKAPCWDSALKHSHTWGETMGQRRSRCWN